ncbi:MAG TPA: FAD-dependent oxidoreductase [Acidobacteriota bacterium]|jgi:NADH dehydrogenase
MPKRQIIVIGGGFAGVFTAMELEKRLGPEEANICLVNRENYFVYQPMLPEIISGSIGLTDTVVPIRALCPRTNLVMREVEEIDLKARTVTVSPGFHPRAIVIHYDHLIIAMGAVPDFGGLPGFVEHVMPFRTLTDALRLRNRVISALEEADIERDPDLRRKLLTFVVAGAGFSGVEVIAELNDFVTGVTRHFRNIIPHQVHCVLVHSGKRILPEMVESLGVFAQDQLIRRGVEIILNDRLIAVTSEKAILKSGLEIPAKTIVSTVPSTIDPVLKELDCPKETGRLAVDKYLQLRGYEGEVWALGDCALVPTASGGSAPPTAQHAVREARTAAENICAHIRGRPSQPFDFEELGRLGSLGHHSAVAEVMGVRISGLVAWLLWRFVYLAKMPGLNRKVRVAADWLIGLVFPPDFVQLKIGRPPGITEQHVEPGEIVFYQGDVGDSVYVIQQGQCEVLRTRKGVQQRVAVLGTGDYFGEMAVLHDASRNATIRALSPLDLLVIAKRDFQKLKSNIPAFAKIFDDVATKRAVADEAEKAMGAASPNSPTSLTP